ncbi:MAG TPA: hypothetical protein VFA94_15635 [Acidimicrobiales bacterium]|nr:hypothetical protein [Acidimicrobiales bacterium]
MPGSIKVQPGPPNQPWLSPSIRLRSQKESDLRNIGTHVEPLNGHAYYTYVRVDNTGNEPFGRCRCPATGAWSKVPYFVDQNPPTNGPGGQRLVVQGGQATLQDSTGVAVANFSPSLVNDFWAWSPDGRLFAYVRRDYTTRDWSIEVVTTATYVRTDGRTVARGRTVHQAGPLVSTSPQATAGANFGWTPASTCLVVAHPPVPGQSANVKYIDLACPSVGMSTTSDQCRAFNAQILTSPQTTGVDILFSPCGGLAALVPTPTGYLQLVDLITTAADQPIRQDNRPVSVTVNAAGRTIATSATGRRGITLTNMSYPSIDNPECLLGGSVTVEARRVFASTTPGTSPMPINLSPGASSAAIWNGEYLWVELPPHTFTRAVPGTSPEHWCLLARADAAPVDAAPPWTQFSTTERHFAQRNIAIT